MSRVLGNILCDLDPKKIHLQENTLFDLDLDPKVKVK